MGMWDVDCKFVKEALMREYKKRIGNVEEVRRRPKVQHLPFCLRGNKTFDEFYIPKLISFGPLLIYQDMHWESTERYKFMWTSKYLQDTNQSFHDLFNTINDQLDDLKELFVNDIHASGENLVCLLIVDACSILHVLDKSYCSNSPELELNISVDELIRVLDDILLLHSQIPFKILKIICNDEAKLNRCLQNLLRIHGFMLTSKGTQVLSNHTIVQIQEQVQAEEKNDPLHLLDYLHRAVLMRSGDAPQIPHREIISKWRSLHLRKYRIGSIRELKEVGIRVLKHRNDTFSHPTFVDGTLNLPMLTVDGSTAVIFMNLIAHEMSPDFNNNFEISSYIVFMSSLIEQPEDVKELRNGGIVVNELASDREVANLFNKLDTLLVPETARYADIRDQIQMYVMTKRSKIKMLGWFREATNTFFRSPWAIIAVLAATLGLTLTFIQTWFAVHPKGS
ncbi:hypothetical protein OROGR_004139 [Orobanche gracilis]